MDVRLAICLFATTAAGMLAEACGGKTDTPMAPPLSTASLTITFAENPVPFRSSACSALTPQGWYTSARIQETRGVTFTPKTFTQKLNGSPAGVLAESFNSRFGACSDSPFTEGVIQANGAVCGTVGVCTESTFANYQIELTGTDANDHELTFTSPLLQFGVGPAVTSSDVPRSLSSVAPERRSPGQFHR